MPSIIPGYEYDIFVSYRQKDNAYDGWVTTFIDHLTRELEATFKDKVHVYFDENKYDGIQEIHHVEDSLSGKLRCVVFIPIVSQTYCDPKSYAWKSEFMHFKEMATNDSFGLKVKLPNGNVTSRILPIRIHELDRQDQALLEEQLGEPLRAIDFIFKAPGVNRPLSASEDHPADNENKIYYRDQINKVANLIKDIVVALTVRGAYDEVAPLSPKVIETKRTRPVPRVWLGVAAAIVLAAVLYYFIQAFGVAGNGSLNKRVAIAVLPFKVIGDKDDGQYFADGVMDVILSNLTLFSELKVKPRSSVEKYRETTLSNVEIGRQLGVTYLLYGSAQKHGDNVRIVVQLIDVRNDVNVWSDNYVKKVSDVFETQNQISESIARHLKAQLTADIAKRINQVPTNDFEAYDLFLRAKQLSRKYDATQDDAFLNQAITLLGRSIDRDNDFALGYAWLAGLTAIKKAGALDNKPTRDSVLYLARTALSLDSTLVEANLVLSQLYDLDMDDVNTLRYSYKALGSPQIDSLTAAQLVKRLASIYSRVGDVDKAIYLYDLLLEKSPQNKEVLELEFIPLAAAGAVERLTSLKEQMKQLNGSQLSAAVALHIAMETNNNTEALAIHQRLQALGNFDFDALDQYVFVMAAGLREQGRDSDANKLVDDFEKYIHPEDFYLLSQVAAFKGKVELAFNYLEQVEVGWYNLTYCALNPAFANLRGDERFNDFMKRNTDRINDVRMRINQLERTGYLPTPIEFFGQENALDPLSQS